jgi:isopentenyldiphosphate isomerase
LDVVDECDGVKGKETREKIHATGLWHRGVHVLLFDSEERLILQVRSDNKDKYPNPYDTSVSEHLELGEEYENAAYRGLREELGIDNVGLKKILKFRMRYGPNDNMISEIYECQSDGVIQIDETEIKRMEGVYLTKIREMLVKDENKFASWTKEILKWYLKLPSKLLIPYDRSGIRRR